MTRGNTWDWRMHQLQRLPATRVGGRTFGAVKLLPLHQQQISPAYYTCCGPHVCSCSTHLDCLHPDRKHPPNTLSTMSEVETSYGRRCSKFLQLVSVLEPLTQGGRPHRLHMDSPATASSSKPRPNSACALPAAGTLSEYYVSCQPVYGTPTLSLQPLHVCKPIPSMHVKVTAEHDSNALCNHLKATPWPHPMHASACEQSVVSTISVNW